MPLIDILDNRVLLAGMSAWVVGQLLKFPLDYLLNRRWRWGVILSPGGLPSSHSALVTATSLSIGLFEGFGNALFALSVAVAMIVIYDATGVRRQAGLHAQALNEIIQKFFSGKPISDKKLREVLGHSPVEVITGITLGVLVALLVWWIFPVK